MLNETGYVKIENRKVQERRMYMNYKSLNEMIMYIEKNLDGQIDLNYLSKITNVNLFILERIFMFLTGMTLIDYIKKRRLSKAFEEIRNTDNKIIDIAFKYHYNSSSSFNRAFKQLFHMTPTECRRKTKNYKVIPIVYFEKKENKFSFDYEIRQINKIVLYGYSVSSKDYPDLLYKIRNLYKKIKTNQDYEAFSRNGMYGIFYKDKEGYHYYLGSKKKSSKLETYEIKKGKYVVFRLSSRDQKDIVSFEDKIEKQWVPATNYTVFGNTRIEFYEQEYCYIFLPIE